MLYMPRGDNSAEHPLEPTGADDAALWCSVYKELIDFVDGIVEAETSPRGIADPTSRRRLRQRLGHLPRRYWYWEHRLHLPA